MYYAVFYPIICLKRLNSPGAKKRFWIFCVFVAVEISAISVIV